MQVLGLWASGSFIKFAIYTFYIRWMEVFCLRIQLCLFFFFSIFFIVLHVSE